jgi:hypothetical protein
MKVKPPRQFPRARQALPGSQVVTQNAENNLCYKLFTNADLYSMSKPELHGDAMRNEIDARICGGCLDIYRQIIRGQTRFGVATSTKSWFYAAIGEIARSTNGLRPYLMHQFKTKIPTSWTILPMAPDPHLCVFSPLTR